MSEGRLCMTVDWVGIIPREARFIDMTYITEYEGCRHYLDFATAEASVSCLIFDDHGYCHEYLELFGL